MACLTDKFVGITNNLPWRYHRLSTLCIFCGEVWCNSTLTLVLSLCKIPLTWLSPKRLLYEYAMLTFLMILIVCSQSWHKGVHLGWICVLDTTVLMEYVMIPQAAWHVCVSCLSQVFLSPKSFNMVVSTTLSLYIGWLLHDSLYRQAEVCRVCELQNSSWSNVVFLWFVSTA